jgi:lipopolysaccharide export LptBFGC system permease protein LptF
VARRNQLTIFKFCGKSCSQCVILLGTSAVFPALFLASCLRLTPRCFAFFLALCPRKRAKNSVRHSLAKQLWQTLNRDAVQNFQAQLGLPRARLRVRGANRSESSSLNLRVDEFQFPDG